MMSNTPAPINDVHKIGIIKGTFNSAVQPKRNSPIGIRRLDHTISGSRYSGFLSPSPFAVRETSILSLNNADIETPTRKPAPRPR